MWGKCIVALLLMAIVGCAGIQTQQVHRGEMTNRSGKYLVFPFRDPSYKNLEFPGIGSRFTRSFVAQCSLHGLKIVDVSNETFNSSKDVDLQKALAYADQNGFDYIVTGQVTRWIDRATEWNAKRDFAGLEIFVRNVKTQAVVFSAELLEHSNIFWSGTPDDFVTSLSRAMAERFRNSKKGSSSF